MSSAETLDNDPRAQLLCESISDQALVRLACKIRFGRRAPETCRVTASSWGAFNLIKFLIFEDGVKWACKIPLKDRGDWQKSDTFHFRNNANLMRLLRRNSNIPVPAVHAISTSFRNTIRRPYVIMDTVDGVPIMESWTDSSVELTALNRRQLQTVADVARVVTELDRFYFDEIGVPVFNNDGKLKAKKKLHSFMVNTELEPIGPYDNAKDLLLDRLEQQGCPVDFHTLWLRRFLDCTEHLDDRIGYTLFHHDLSPSNIIVDKATGKLRGIIDWDFAHTMPDIMGKLSYPLFICGDWAHIDAEQHVCYLAGAGYRRGHIVSALEPSSQEDPHEPYDHLRTVWRLAINEYKNVPLDRLHVKEVPVDHFLQAVPQSRSLGLSHHETVPLRILRNAVDSPPRLVRYVQHIFTKILFMDQNFPEIGKKIEQAMVLEEDTTILNVLSDEESEAVIPDMTAEHHRLVCKWREEDPTQVELAILFQHEPEQGTLPPLTELIVATNRGQIDDYVYARIKAWFFYLFYGGMNYRPSFSCDMKNDAGSSTKALLDHLQDRPVENSETEWSDYFTDVGYAEYYLPKAAPSAKTQDPSVHAPSWHCEAAHTHTNSNGLRLSTEDSDHNSPVTRFRAENYSLGLKSPAMRLTGAPQIGLDVFDFGEDTSTLVRSLLLPLSTESSDIDIKTEEPAGESNEARHVAVKPSTNAAPHDLSLVSATGKMSTLNSDSPDEPRKSAPISKWLKKARKSLKKPLKFVNKLKAHKQTATEADPNDADYNPAQASAHRIDDVMEEGDQQEVAGDRAPLHHEAHVSDAPQVNPADVLHTESPPAGTQSVKPQNSRQKQSEVLTAEVIAPPAKQKSRKLSWRGLKKSPWRDVARGSWQAIKIVI